MTKKQKKVLYRIIISGGIYALLLGLELTGVLESLPEIVCMVLFMVPYLIIGYDVLRKAFLGIKNGQLFDENFLMSIATMAAVFIGEYSESVAVMLFYQVGELFQSYAVGKSRQSISDMMELAADYAYRIVGDETEEVDPEEVSVGDMLLIRPGEKIPLDGVVIEGESFLDTKALTGESVPRRITAGEEIYSGCINGEGTLRIKVTKEYEDSTVAKILDMVENASEKKARLENFITRFAKYYTPVVTFGAALLAILPPLILHQPFAGWIRRACIFLIVSCPCALVISVPLGFFGGIGAASRIGVLVKGSNYLEMLAYVKAFVFDKTGTITKGEFAVLEVIPTGDEESLLAMAGELEKFSTHPIAQSIVAAYENKAKSEKEANLDIKDVKNVAGKGLFANAVMDGKSGILYAGSDALMEENGIDFDKYEGAGTVVYVAYDGEFLGTIVVGDSVKEGSAEGISSLRETGAKTCMLTGDREHTAKAVAGEVGVDDYYSQLLPQDKVSALESIMKKYGRSAFVGDGINDAPVLMRSDVGFAMGAVGSDAAIEAADIVLMDDDMRKLAKVLVIAKRTVRIVRENIVFAIGVKLLVLVLGALGIANMWGAVFADVGVAVLAILNSMRLMRNK